MQTGSGSDLISNSGSATLIVTICYLLFLLEVYASMLMISLTTFLITSPDNNVAPDINKIISVPELRIRIPTGPEPNDYSYRIQILMMIRVLILIHIFVRVRIHLNLTAGYEYTGPYQTCTKQGQTVHMLQLFLDIYSISPPIYICIYINTYIHIYKYIYNIHIYS